MTACAILLFSAYALGAAMTLMLCLGVLSDTKAGLGTALSVMFFFLSFIMAAVWPLVLIAAAVHVALRKPTPDA